MRSGAKFFHMPSHVFPACPPKIRGPTWDKLSERAPFGTSHTNRATFSTPPLPLTEGEAWSNHVRSCPVNKWLPRPRKSSRGLSMRLWSRQSRHFPENWSPRTPREGEGWGESVLGGELHKMDVCLDQIDATPYVICHYVRMLAWTKPGLAWTMPGPSQTEHEALSPALLAIASGKPSDGTLARLLTLAR